jgi:hypothetical protein
VPDDRAQRQARVVERLRERIRAGEVRPFDGMVWLAHLDAAGTPRLFSRVSDPVADLDELYLLDLLTTLEAIGLPGVTVAIWRADGVPVAVDRRLARDLTNRLTPDGVTTLDAVMVVNAHGCRPVRPSRPERPATRRDRRPSRSKVTGRDKSGRPAAP